MECILCLGVRELQTAKYSNDHPFEEYLVICKKYLTVDIMQSEFDRSREFHFPICTVCFCSVETLYKIHCQLREVQEKFIEYSVSFSEILNSRRKENINTTATSALDVDEGTGDCNTTTETELFFQCNEQMLEDDFESYDGDNDYVHLERESQMPVPIDSTPPRKESFDTHKIDPHIDEKADRKKEKLSISLLNSDTNNESRSIERDRTSDEESETDEEDENVLFGCWKCNKKCKTREEFDAHSRSHLPPQVDFCTCSLCGDKLSSKTQLEKHIQTVHKYDDKTFKCEICGKMYKTETHLKYHKRGHTSERTHKCDVCDKSYFWSSNVKVHKYTAHGIGPPVKPQKEYNYKLKTYSKKQSYCCEECGKIFTVKQNFDDHTRLHTGEKPFHCNEKYCEMAFRTIVLLKSHKAKNHALNVRFVCPIQICKKKFQYQYELRNHRSIAHSTDEDKVNCNYCGKEYDNNARLQRHLNGVHKKESWPHVCNTCGIRQPSSQKLENHIRTHTGEKPFECTQCNKHFTSKTRLYCHRKEKGH